MGQWSRGTSLLTWSTSQVLCSVLMKTSLSKLLNHRDGNRNPVYIILCVCVCSPHPLLWYLLIQYLILLGSDLFTVTSTLSSPGAWRKRSTWRPSWRRSKITQALVMATGKPGACVRGRRQCAVRSGRRLTKKQLNR